MESLAKSPATFDLEWRVTVKKAEAIDATKYLIYRAILFSNIQSFHEGGMGVGTEKMIRLGDAFGKFVKSSTYESEKVAVLCSRSNWLVKDTWLLAKKLYAQEPDDLSMHLAVLLGNLGYGNHGADQAMVVKEISGIQSKYPQLTGLWLMSVLTKIREGNIHQERKKDEFLAARAALKVYVAKISTPSSYADHLAKGLNEALAKMK